MSTTSSAPASPPTDTQTIDEAVERAGLGKFQWQLLAICGLTWAADAAEVLLMAFALPGISKLWGVEKGSTTATLLLSATFAGMLVGALFWGWLADRIGRRSVFLMTVSLSVIFGLAGAFAPNITVLVILRVLTGFALGGTLPADYAMMAEFVPAKWRGKFLVYLESFWAIGTILVAALAWWLMTVMDPTEAWRWLLGIMALPALIGLIARIYVPDSPRSLLLRGKKAEARQALERVAHRNGRTLSDAELVIASEGPRAKVRDLFIGKLSRRTILIAVVWFGLSLGYYGIFSWLPSYLAAQGLSLGAVYRTTLILAVAQIPGYMLAAYLVDKIGRRATVAGFLATSSLGAYLFLIADTPTTVLVTSSLLSFALLGAWGSVYAYTPELFPTDVRTTGMGLASGAARLASVISPSVGALLVTGQLPVALTVFAGCLLIAALAGWFIGVETRGRALKDTIE